MYKKLTTALPFFVQMLTIVGLLAMLPGESTAQNRSFIDAWVFQNKSQDQFRKELVAELESAIKKLNDDFDLSEDLIAKFRLAGEVDIQRFLREAERLRRETEGIQLSQETLNLFVQDLAPLRRRIQAGFFDDSSLFRKTVQTVLSPEQLQAHSQRDLWKKLDLRNRTFVTRPLILDLRQPSPLQLFQPERLKELKDTRNRIQEKSIRRPDN